MVALVNVGRGLVGFWRGGIGLAAAALFLATVLPSVAAEARSGRRPAPAYASIVMDAKTGRVLQATHADAPRFPASITKVMTLYLLFEELERGRLRLDSELTVSARAARMPPSKIGFDPGDTISVEDAIKALVVKSANDVAAAVAENLAGSEEAFAERMTRRARALGMHRTTFRNASGLPNPEQVTTARDLTILGRAIEERFPRYFGYFETRSFAFDGRVYRNHNRLLGRVDGVDGIKTGYTRASGFNLLTSAKDENRHIIAVVLGGRTGRARDRAMAQLVEAHLPRAFAGARTLPRIAVAEAESDRAIVTATAAQRPALRPAPETPSAAPAALPPQALALAAVPHRVPAAAPANPAPAAAAPAAIPSRVPRTAATPPRADVPAPPAATRNAQPPRRGFVIQIAAIDDEAKARALLDTARQRHRAVLSEAQAFTETVQRGGQTLFRARFGGFGDDSEAQAACSALRRSGVACFVQRVS